MTCLRCSRPAFRRCFQWFLYTALLAFVVFSACETAISNAFFIAQPLQKTTKHTTTPRSNESYKESPSKGKLWAVLVAGSSGFFNYRHQADICHAYQILRAHGIAQKRIIVMMYDDIAYHRNNPTKGIIVNHPYGIDVYRNVGKDYTGRNVTVKNFLNVLQGIGSGKVLETGPLDRIFIYFSDHGAAGLIAFPNGLLFATTLNKVLRQMHAERKYESIVIYIESCESGSMFNTLLNEDLNVYVTTASSPTQSSFACYYDPIRQTYLGDVYSVHWMEDSDQRSLIEETLREQYLSVKTGTNTSEVEEYGNLTIGFRKVSEYQGKATPFLNYLDVRKTDVDSVDSREVPMAILLKRLEAASTDREKRKIEAEIEELSRKQRIIESKVRDIVQSVMETDDKSVDKMMQDKMPIQDWTCYEAVVKKFHSQCFDMAQNPYALRFARVFVNLCESGYAFAKYCEHLRQTMHT